MKNYEIYYRLRGPGGEIMVPNMNNPLPGESLLAVLKQIVEGFPELHFGIEMVGIAVEEKK